MTTQLTRRETLLTAAAALLVGEAHAQTPEIAPLRRFAFGACARQNKEQPIWDEVLKTAPELFVFLGDNVYGDTHDPAELRAKYQALAGKPGFQKLKASTPMLAMWDDHDYGKNDSGADHPTKNESRAAFCDFWEEPANGPRRSQDGGVFTSTMIGPPGRGVQFILPDLRWNRTKLRRPGGFPLVAGTWIAGQIFRGAEVKGPYRPSRDETATMIGEAQWAWLEAEFAKPAALRIFGSSLQVLARGSGWEAWENFPKDAARLEKLIGTASNVVLLSGDVHYGELSKADRTNAPPLWELTSSGLTESDPSLINNNRVDVYDKGPNFGVVDIDWAARSVKLQVIDERGVTRIERAVPFG
ncbi:MAG: alkaline phosphatase D family protein [Alphaproteobacteria bacterium]|nr:alkaline phosphatase D family protein [Alphaproteobacteria bacterium]